MKPSLCSAWSWSRVGHPWVHRANRTTRRNPVWRQQKKTHNREALSSNDASWTGAGWPAACQGHGRERAGQGTLGPHSPQCAKTPEQHGGRSVNCSVSFCPPLLPTLQCHESDPPWKTSSLLHGEQPKVEKKEVTQDKRRKPASTSSIVPRLCL